MMTNESEQSERREKDQGIGQLRLPQDFGVEAGVEKRILSVPVRKPNRCWFVRTHPGEECRMACGVIELPEQRETYIVHQRMIAELALEVVAVQLYLAITRTGTLFLWPVRLPAASGRWLEWHRSAAEAATIAMAKWVRVAADMSAGAYHVYEATGKLPEPNWPDIPFEELITIAFNGKIVDSLDHPVVRQLRGET